MASSTTIARECAHDAAMMGARDNQAFPFELSQRLPHGNPGRTELLGEAGLVELLVVLEVSPQDRVSQRFDDELRGGAPIGQGGDHRLRHAPSVPR